MKEEKENRAMLIIIIVWGFVTSTKCETNNKEQQ
jgi:hypothetical protein